MTVAGLAVFLVATACSDGPTSPREGTSEVADVLPADGATGVNPAAPIVLEFSHAAMAGMEQYLAVHEGGITGSVVAGSWTWSADRRTLTFTPSAPLRSRTTYTIHTGMGMMDAAGNMTGSHAGHHPGNSMPMTGGGMMGAGMMNDAMTDCVVQSTFTTA